MLILSCGNGLGYTCAHLLHLWLVVMGGGGIQLFFFNSLYFSRNCSITVCLFGNFLFNRCLTEIVNKEKRGYDTTIHEC